MKLISAPPLPPQVDRPQGRARSQQPGLRERRHLASLIPALSQRRAETEVILRDGESFAIAGLIDNRVIETISKVPGLGDLPVLGKIFRSRSTQKSADELLVVVTPYFVKPLTPEEKAKLPVMPETFLPAAKPEPDKKGKTRKRASSPRRTRNL